MKRVAVLLTQSPHGSAVGREGLDALLSTSALTDNVAIFFLSDGVLHLLPNQKPADILARDYIATFGVLPLYDITQRYACLESLTQRGIELEHQLLILDVVLLTPIELSKHLAEFDFILTF